MTAPADWEPGQSMGAAGDQTCCSQLIQHMLISTEAHAMLSPLTVLLQEMDSLEVAPGCPGLHSPECACPTQSARAAASSCTTTAERCPCEPIRGRCLNMQLTRLCCSLSWQAWGAAAPGTWWAASGCRQQRLSSRYCMTQRWMHVLVTHQACCVQRQARPEQGEDDEACQAQRPPDPQPAQVACVCMRLMPRLCQHSTRAHAVVICASEYWLLKHR